MTKHAIVTGGMGFIGHAVCKELIEQDCRVTPIDDLRFTNKRLLRKRHEHIYYRLWHKGRADDLGLLYRNIRSKDTTIFHLASHPNQAAVAADPYGACDNIVGVTSRIAHFCAENSIRMVYISSSMVYGNWLNTKAVEDQPLSPVNLYGMYKKQAEEIVRQVLPGQHTIIRPSAVYGPLDNDNRVIMRWINAAIAGKPLRVDDPDAILDFTYVDDLAFGIVKAADKQMTDTFNITGGYGYTLYEAAQMIVSMTNSSSEILLGTGLGKDHPRRGVLDINKAKNLLGYSPKINLSHGLNVVLAWAGS
jgi:nucleoside-diphosphate-sugar epimerase